MHQGHIFIVSSPSGGGKTTLVHAVSKRLEKTVISISYTTRPKRAQEKEGQHYHFVSMEAFQALMQQNAFVECAEVFGNWYGTAKAKIDQILSRGEDVLLDIDWQGARQVKKSYPAAVGIFLLPPSKHALEERLLKRKQDRAEVVQARMIQAQAEISHYDEYDYLVENNVLEDAILEVCAIVCAKRLEFETQQHKLRSLLSSLVGK